uniref:Uncharacterized protein n=1 Tax=Lepeophtheirus salmonis TaxID=72036 RepID=A0A0K2TPR7_LEPSM
MQKSIPKKKSAPSLLVAKYWKKLNMEEEAINPRIIHSNPYTVLSQKWFPYRLATFSIYNNKSNKTDLGCSFLYRRWSLRATYFVSVIE